MEQSNNVENKFDQSNRKSSARMQQFTRVISVTSGKGGVGKTNLVSNLALSLSRLGQSVLILDADMGLANIDIMLGLQPKYTIRDVLNGSRRLDEILLNGPEGVCVIPSASGIESVSLLSASERQLLVSAVEELSVNFDYLLIDTSAGISSDVMYFNSVSNEIIVVITAEPTSLTDAYAVIKVLTSKYKERRFNIVANDVVDDVEGRRAFGRLQKATDRYLQTQLRYLGSIPTDSHVSDSICAQRALIELFPSSPAGMALSSLARKIDEERFEFRIKGGMQFFFKQLLEGVDNRRA